MNEILTWTLIIIAVGLTIQFVVLSLRHENLLREHTRAIRELSSNSERDEPWDFTEKVKGIYKYVQIIAWICVFFCVCVCLHYLCGYCPRVKSPVEADYIGIIVGILSAIITLLVGWNIYSTIKAKEELADSKKNVMRSQRMIERRYTNFINTIKQNYGDRLKQLNQCCTDGQIELKRLDKKIDVVNNASLLFVSAQGLIKASRFEDKTAKTDSFMISMAYSTLWHAVYQFMASKTDKRNILGCISQMKTCLMMLSIDELKIIKEHLEMASNWYDKIIALDKELKDSEVMVELKEVVSAQTQIGYDEEWEERRAAFAKFEEQRAKIETEESAEAKGDTPPDPAADE